MPIRARLLVQPVPEKREIMATIVRATEYPLVGQVAGLDKEEMPNLSLIDLLALPKLTPYAPFDASFLAQFAHGRRTRLLTRFDSALHQLPAGEWMRKG